ncbi:MAG: hypothetical protein ABI612_06405 [Betaproteobacteria bacterium]
MRLISRIACVYVIATGVAFAAPEKFKAEIQDDTVIIYSSIDKPAMCSASVMYSYKYQDGRRTARLECNSPTPAQKDYVFCKRKNAEYVDLKIERGVQGNCE